MNEQQVRQALASVVPDDLGVDLVSAGLVSRIAVQASELEVELGFGYPFAGVADVYRRQVEAALAPLLAGRRLNLSLHQAIRPSQPQQGMPANPEVRNIIAVASGKGGVGKSTTAVNLALGLQAEGARVGILDADVFGPSVPAMLGVPDGTRPGVRDERFFIPVTAHGLQTMSIGYVVDERTPVVWRGPKASGALQQLFGQTWWQGLDYLVVDMPPGTGDIQLTLAQKVPVAGAVIVTTPQDIALLDAVKGIEMFRKVDIRVLGVVENMAVHRCSNCGHEEHIFGEGGAQRIVEHYHTALLGSLPLALSIRENADSGVPTVARDPDSAEARLYRDIARRAAARLSLQAPGRTGFPRVVMED